MRKNLIVWALVIGLAMTAAPAMAAASATTWIDEDTSALKNNVDLACAALDGIWVPAGGYFSFNDTVGERTSATGYQSALNGRGVKAMAGGVSQVAATLYLALEDRGDIKYIEKRTYGSRYKGNYVSSGSDAILTDYNEGIDFTFRNNGSGFTIEAYRTGEKVTVRLTGSSSGSSGSSGASSESGSVRATGDANVRSKPSLKGTILGTAGKGTILTYLSSKSTDDRGVVWYKVRFNGETGWISSRYSTLAGGSSTGSSGSSGSSSGSGTVKATGDVNVRSKPSLKGSILGTAKEGMKLTYLGEKSTDDRGVVWYKVRFNGKPGWISSKYSTLSGSKKSTDKSAKSSGKTIDGLEVSGYYLNDLYDAVDSLGVWFESSGESEAGELYTDGALTIGGWEVVEYIEIEGAGYTLFGVGVGTDADAAYQMLQDAGLLDRSAGSEMYFEHPAGADSLVDVDGCDSGILVNISNGVVQDISWSSYTG